MQTTANVHHHIASPCFPQPDRLFEHTAAFDTAVDLFDAHAPPRDLAGSLFLLRRSLLPTWLLRRLDDVYSIQRERVKAQVLQQVTPCGKWRRRRVHHARILDTSLLGLTQEQHAPSGLDQQDVLQLTGCEF